MDRDRAAPLFQRRPASNRRRCADHARKPHERASCRLSNVDTRSFSPVRIFQIFGARPCPNTDKAARDIRRRLFLKSNYLF